MWGLIFTSSLTAIGAVTISIKLKKIHMPLIRFVLGFPALFSTVYIYYKHIWINRIEAQLKEKYSKILPAYSGDFSQKSLDLLIDEDELLEEDKNSTLNNK